MVLALDEAVLELLEAVELLNPEVGRVHETRLELSVWCD
jgi:hypothetical protein